MMRILLQRLAWAVFIVWAVTTVTFAINNVLPGDPARMLAGPQANAEDVKLIREEMGLDRPLLSQYRIFLKRLVHPGPWTFEPKDEHRSCAAIVPGLHVDFGWSYQRQAPVVKIIWDRLPLTIWLAAAAIAIQLGVGTAAGVFAARRRGTIFDHATLATTLLGISAPTYLIGILLQFIFAYKMRILPFDGYGQSLADHALAIVLPALTLGIFGAAYYTRLVRDEMLVLLRADYVRTARAKGLSERSVVVRHALRNALVPLVTVVGLEAGALVGGAIVTEQIFRWPGMGALSVNALLNRDGPMIVGIVIVTSTAIVLANVIVDLLYAALDPRVRAR